MELGHQIDDKNQFINFKHNQKTNDQLLKQNNGNMFSQVYYSFETSRCLSAIENL